MTSRRRGTDCSSKRSSCAVLPTQWRRLPPGRVVPKDYVFAAQGSPGDPTDLRMSELFAPGQDSLVIYSMMFPRGARR